MDILYGLPVELQLNIIKFLNIEHLNCILLTKNDETNMEYLRKHILKILEKIRRKVYNDISKLVEKLSMDTDGHVGADYGTYKDYVTTIFKYPELSYSMWDKIIGEMEDELCASQFRDVLKSVVRFEETYESTIGNVLEQKYKFDLLKQNNHEHPVYNTQLLTFMKYMWLYIYH